MWAERGWEGPGGLAWGEDKNAALHMPTTGVHGAQPKTPRYRYSPIIWADIFNNDTIVTNTIDNDISYRVVRCFVLPIPIHIVHI